MSTTRITFLGRRLCDSLRVRLKVVRDTDTATRPVRLELIITDGRTLSIAQVSNTLGTINDVTGSSARAHQVGALVMLDGSHSVGPQMPVDGARAQHRPPRVHAGTDARPDRNRRPPCTVRTWLSCPRPLCCLV